MLGIKHIFIFSGGTNKHKTVLATIFKLFFLCIQRLQDVIIHVLYAFQKLTLVLEMRTLNLLQILQATFGQKSVQEPGYGQAQALLRCSLEIEYW